jgi:hypothetical protein
MVANMKILRGMAEYMATSTLVDLLKKDEDEIAKMRLNLSEMCVQPSRLLASSCTLVK